MPSAISSPEGVRALQERAARALPAEHVDEADGWRLRHHPSSSWWVGTVLPHADAAESGPGPGPGAAGPGELAARIAAAEEFYAGHAAVARFQITPGVCPESLDTALAERGYLRQSPASLQTAPTARVLEQAPPSPPPRIRLDDRPTRAWFDGWLTVHGGGDSHAAEWDLLARVRQPGVYASALSGDRVVAVGRAVADTGWAGVFSMATLPEARGKGAARAVLAALARWAAAHAADRMYLQVQRENGPARRLYERAGFTEVRRYHYRSARSAG